MGQLFTGLFWRDAFERAFSTAAQAVLVVTGLDVTDVTSITLDFKVLALAAVYGFVLTILKSVAASYVGSKNSASLVNTKG